MNAKVKKYPANIEIIFDNGRCHTIYTDDLDITSADIDEFAAVQIAEACAKIGIDAEDIENIEDLHFELTNILDNIIHD